MVLSSMFVTGGARAATVFFLNRLILRGFTTLI
jgi:hypothetical protein